MLDRTGYIEPPSRRSPLEHRPSVSADSGAIELSERKFIGKIILRGDAAKVAPLLEGISLPALPLAPCTSAMTGEATVLWLGPSEWMLLTPENGERALIARIEEAVRNVHHQLVDLTDYYTIIHVSGERAREALMKLTTLDLHLRQFPAGAVKGSVLGRVNAILHSPPSLGGEPSGFDLIIRWSQADYLWCLLCSAGREYGLPRQLPEGRV
jgi:sarcosine oxidase subunit gamma